MMDGALIVLGCTVLVVVVALIGAALQDRRGMQLQQAADEIGFTFKREDQVLAVELFGAAAANAVRVQNVLFGQAYGLEVFVFDLLQLVRRAQYVRHVRFTLLVCRDEHATWPVFALNPRQFLSRLGGMSGGGTPMFENDVAFARRYRLEAVDPEAVSEIFTEEARRYFTNHPGLWVQGKEQKLTISQGKVMPASGLRAFLENGFEVMNVLKGEEPKV